MTRIEPEMVRTSSVCSPAPLKGSVREIELSSRTLSSHGASAASGAMSVARATVDASETRSIRIASPDLLKSPGCAFTHGFIQHGIGRQLAQGVGRSTAARFDDEV